MGGWNTAENEREHERDDEVGDRDDDGEQQQAGATGHAYTGYEPDGGRGGEPLDAIVVHKDDAGADEADAGDDLRGNTGWIEHDATGGEDIHEAVLRDEQEEGGGGADDRIGSEAGALMAKLPLKADQCRENEGRGELEELRDGLACGGEEVRDVHADCDAVCEAWNMGCGQADEAAGLNWSLGSRAGQAHQDLSFAAREQSESPEMAS